MTAAGGGELRGDPRSIEALATSYRRVALRIARGVLGDVDDAEDVAQDVMIRFAAALPGFERVDDLDPWVYRVTANRCRDHLRRRVRRRFDVPVREATHHPALVTEDEPDRGLDLERARAAVARAVDRLPPDQREALHLRYVEGRGYAEIADLTDTAQGTIASRVFRALRRLGGELAPIHLEVLK